LISRSSAVEEREAKGGQPQSEAEFGAAAESLLKSKF
jgi:hypothetical protein